MKHLMLSVLLGLFASNAYATQARLIALGLNELDDEGSYYIKDSRNIFLNPAWINEFPDRLIVEWGSNGASVVTAAVNTTVEQDNNQKAQGGFLKKSGDFVYGVYYGNESNTSSFLRVAASGTAATIASAAQGSNKMVPTADNQLEVFFGGDNGIQWGVNVVYLNNKDELVGNAKDTASAVRLGVKDGDKWDAHVNMSTSNKGERTSDINLTTVGVDTSNQTGVKNEFKGKFGIQVGGSYNLGNWGRPFASVKHFSWEQVDNYNYSTFNAVNLGATLGTSQVGKQGTSEGKFTDFKIGWGKVTEVNSTDKLFVELFVKKVDVELEVARKVEVSNLTVPLVLGYEAAATSWLTLRGSITQNLYGTRDNKNFSYANPVVKNLVTSVYGSEGKGTVTNSTAIAAGASLTFGDLVVDGMIGGAKNLTGSASSKTDGNLNLDQFMTSVAMTYAF